MKIKTIVLSAIVAAGFSYSFSQSSISKREFRGAWIATVTNIDWPSSTRAANPKQELITILDRLQSYGINAVIFQVRPECDAFYDSPYEPWSYYLTGSQGSYPGFDPLAFAVDEAHKRGMELHAWFNPYRAERSAGYYITGSTHVTKTHPEWILQVGSVRFLNPGLPDVRNHVAKVIADVVRRYDIDAAHMDDYFYVQGITSHDAAAYAADPRGLQLADWRRDNVNRLVKQIYDSIQTIKPWVKWGISPSGIWKWGTPAGITGMSHYNELYCDPLAWMNGKYLDYLAPQLYWKFGGSQDYGLLQPWWASVMNGRHLYPGLAPYRIGETTYGTASQVTEQIRFNRSTGNTKGAIHYTTNSLTSNMGGIADSLIKDIYRYPALIPSFSWKDSIPPNPPRNIRFGRIGSSGFASLLWEEPSPASDPSTGYRYVIYRSANPLSPADLNDPKYITGIAGTRSVTPKLPPVTGTYSYVVTALDRNYNESQAAAAVQIAPPDKPVLASPTDGSGEQKQGISVIWKSSDDASSFNVQVSPDSTFAGSLLVNQVLLVDTVQQVKGMKGRQKYFWRVASNNPSGAGSFSQPRSFVTGFPAAPLLAAPSNYSLDVGLNILLTWNAAATADKYRIQFADAADFNPLSVKIDSILSTTSVRASNLQLNKIYMWRVLAINSIDTSLWSDIFRFRTVTTSVPIASLGLPAEFSLAQNYPNPFNPVTRIRFGIPSEQFVTLKVYDLLGKEAAVLLEENLQAGYYEKEWNASMVPSGVYFCRMTVGRFTESRKLILMK